MKNAHWFLELVHLNAAGNVTTFIEEKVFSPFLNAFMKLLINHQAYIQGHGQNLLLKIDRNNKIIGLVYRDMGGVNLEIKKDDIFLPENLKVDGLSYFSKFKQDACDVLEQQWINRGLYPLTKQLVKNADLFSATDPDFYHWHQWCYAMEGSGIKILKNWTTGSSTDDEHHMALQQTEFCRYGYVENRFGLKLLDYLRQHRLLNEYDLEDLHQQLTLPEEIHYLDRNITLAPCTNINFFDRAISLTLTQQSRIHSLGVKTMLKKAVLQELLTAYDTKPQASLTPSQSTLLMTLRNLSNNARADIELTNPIKNLISRYTLTSSPFTDLSAFDQLISVLGFNAGDDRCQNLTEGDLTTFIGTQTIEVMPEKPTAPIFPNTTEGMFHWLQKELSDIQAKLGGHAEVNLISQLGNPLIQVQVEGSLSMRYACYQLLRKTNAISDDSPTQGLNAANMYAPIQVNLKPAELQKTYADYLTFLNIKQFVQRLGFSVTEGGKSATEAFSSFSDTITRAADLMHAFAIDETVATTLTHEGATIVLPFTFKMETMSDDLMYQMESYFKHELVNLVGANRQPKTFIQETRAPGMLHQSNINIMQAMRLRDLFERMEFFSHKLGKSAHEVTEAEMQAETSKILNGLKNGEHSLRAIIEGKPLAQDLTQQSHHGAASHIMPWLTANNVAQTPSYLGMFAPSLLTPKQFSKDMETYLNLKLIPSPTFFLDDIPLLNQMSRICGVAKENYSIFTFNFDLSSVMNCSTPRSPVPMNLYAKAIAKHCLSPTGRKFKIVETNEGLNREASAWLDKTVDRTTYGSAANQPLLDFYTRNSAYYIIDTLVGQLSEFLDDHVHCDEAAVANILLTLGLNEENLVNFQMPINHLYNRFQIKLMLLPLVTNALIENNLLVNVDKLYASNHKWVTQNVPQNDGLKAYRASTVESWCKQMVSFKLNEIDGKNYGCGGPASTSSSSYQRQTTDYSSFYSGGGQSNTRRVEETQRSNFNYGG